jgi:hypothetical protein
MTRSCDFCDGAVTQKDSYPHDGMTVEIYRCGECTRRGALVYYPDGHTAGRGCLAEQADEQIHAPLDGLWARLGGLIGRLRGDDR